MTAEVESEQLMRVHRFLRVGALVGGAVLLATCTYGERVGSDPAAANTPHNVHAEQLPDEGRVLGMERREEDPYHLVVATTYWIGEDATAENDYISNIPSAWDENTMASFGGIDSPGGRSFRPKHNPFYFALPASEFDETGPVPGAREASPWAGEIGRLYEDESLFKGRWIEVVHGKKVIYAQWHDVGPNAEKDYGYVFGSAPPSNTFGERAGLDLSPDAARALGTGGSAYVRWRFVDAHKVPEGPWTEYSPISNKVDWN